MKFTIGIIHGEQTAEWSTKMWQAWAKTPGMGVDDFEIIFVGPPIPKTISLWNTTFIEFDEKISGAPWITKKKNLITAAAKYDNIVFTHDYITPHENWRYGWINFEDFKVASNCQYIEEDNTYYRHSDWVIEPMLVWDLHRPWTDVFWDVALPYEAKGLSKLQYISGNYWVAKKSVMEEFPLDETLGWGSCEDVIWSRQVRQKYEFSFNPHSIVFINKPNKWKPGLLDQDILKQLCEKHNIPYAF